MKNNPMYAALCALALTAAPAAMADDLVITDWFDVGTGFLGGGQSFIVNVDLDTGEDLLVAGFEFRYDYAEFVSDASWASDSQVMVLGPAGDMFIVGGLTNLPFADEEWSFQGPSSDGNGHYADSGADIFLPWVDDPLPLGLFSVAFTNDWQSDPNENLYDVQVRFYEATPAPGALALLGLAGLVGRGRRRSH